MEVSNPRDDRAERNRGSAEVPLSTVIPRVGNFHLEKNTILDSFSCTTTPQIWFISRFCVIFFGALSLGENTWVRCNFITQAKSVAISVWCARTRFTAQHKPNVLLLLFVLQCCGHIGVDYSGIRCTFLRAREYLKSNIRIYSCRVT